MRKKSQSLAIDTLACQCYNMIKFFVTNGQPPLSNHQLERLTSMGIFMVTKGQVINCPKCQREITIP